MTDEYPRPIDLLWGPCAEAAVQMLRISDGLDLHGYNWEWAQEQISRIQFPLETPADRVRQILDTAGWTDRRLAGLPPLDPFAGFTGVMVLPPKRDTDRSWKRGKRG